VLTALALVSTSSGPANATIDTPLTVNVNNTLIQNGRIFRDGTPSTCAAPKAYPGPFGVGTTYNYAQSTYVAQNTGCLTITRTSADCGGDGPDSTNAHMTLYDGTYNPADQAAHYLGDQGSSANASVMSAQVTEGHTYQIVVSNTAAQANCTVGFTLSIEPNTQIVGATKLRRPTDVINLVGTGGNQFECKVDAGAFAACTSSLSLWATLADGAHTLQARAKDGTGVVDPSPASLTFTRCDLPKLDKNLQKATKKLQQAKRALNQAKKSGNKAAIAKAQKKVKSAKKKVKSAKSARKTCAA
jgi:hypothetical protein